MGTETDCCILFKRKAMKNHTAFLLASHKLNDYIIEQYNKLRKAAENIGDLYLLIEDGNLESIPDDIMFYSFNVDTLNELGYEPIAETIVPGSNHFQILQFYKDHPEYDYYWNIEYDVYFNGDWCHFLLACEFIDVDFISSHIAYYHDIPSWMWWSSMQLKTLSILQTDFIRSFNPIYRISNRALKKLDEVLKQHNVGHHEVFIPTVLYNSGFSIGDLGESENFSVPQIAKSFYSQGIDDNDINCSMRFRPIFDRMDIEKKGIDNLLYHPVKR